MRGRALTLEDKRLVVARLLFAWERAPQQRLGQLLDNALLACSKADLFNVEDEDLALAVEAFVAPVEETQEGDGV